MNSKIKQIIVSRLGRQVTVSCMDSPKRKHIVAFLSRKFLCFFLKDGKTFLKGRFL